MNGMSRVLVANRGEIAIRILRACVDERLETVLAVSAIDRNSLPAQLADRVVCIGPAAATQSYLDVDRILAAAVGTGCDALHPGYGFLAERPELAEACEENDVAFVGPSADTIRRGGDKLACRELARELDIPVGGGSSAVADAAEARERAEEIGYPILLKAAAGGGGKGMVLVREPDAFAERFETAAAEARQAFGDDRIYLEHFFENARHVEVQILGDAHGNLVHLGERDCSYQRRYQKLLEEAPATAVPERIRRDLHDAALRLGRELGYVGAGTVEFIVDQDDGRFAFLEINTRIQVEHPVTEMITGIDLVREQLRAAGGSRLRFTQDDVGYGGHAIECRINAERPEDGFRPAPGRLERWVTPIGTDVRMDTHCYPGYVVPPAYDSLLGKLICRGEDRSDAIARTRHALEQFQVDGVPTTAPFHAALVSHPDFVEERVNTHWVEDVFIPAWTSKTTDSADNEPE